MDSVHIVQHCFINELKANRGGGGEEGERERESEYMTWYSRGMRRRKRKERREE